MNDVADRAARLISQGVALRDAGDDEGALLLYRKAIDAQPDWSVPWYNIGLIHKYAGQWEASLAANREALERDPQDEAAAWNLGIAATALGEWSAARHAWNKCGIRMPEGEGPIEMDCGLTPIRVNPGDAPEVIWSDRIDPARAIVRSVPLPSSKRRFGDLLLHDGAPNGYRLLDGQEVPVFDELAVLVPSAYSTFEARMDPIDEPLLGELTRFCGKHDIEVENWSTGVRVLCKACSEGRPFGDGGHNHGPMGAGGAGVRLGVAARHGDSTRDLIGDWLRGRGGAVRSFECVLPGAPRH